MTVTVQEQLPAWYFARYGRPPHKVDVDCAQDWVHRALRSTKRSVEREFEGRGYVVRVADLSWPRAGVSALGFGYPPARTAGPTAFREAAPVRLRAKLNMRSKELILDPQAEADLHGELEMMGFPLSPSPREVIMAHELFHLFCPKCPAALAELAAHLYAAEVLGLDYFPGLLDIADRFQEHALRSA
jgi:hypothetical protein